jgi:aminopeptidase N
MTNAEELNDLTLGVAGYYKPGLVFRALRATLGDSLFHTAMRRYINTWLLKHPYPNDFFNSFNTTTGQNLDWFWYPWFFTRGTLDLSIGSVTQAPGSVTVTVRDVGQIPAPAIIAVTTDAGVVRRTIPVQQFLTPPNTRSVTVTIPVQGRVTRVEIDPEQQFPDVNRRNNVWAGG